MRNALLFLLIASSVPVPLLGVTLPVFTDFNDDVVGGPPAVGGPNQPSALILDPNGTILVESAALGLNDQPVALSLNQGDRVAVQWEFEIIEDGIVEVKFIASTDRLVSNSFFQALGNGAVRLAIQTLVNGRFRISNRCNQFPAFGSYTPGSPFGMRVRFYPPSEYSLTVDNELNGFDDDAEFVDNYCTGGISAVSLEAHSRLPPSDVVIAFDDVEIVTSDIFADGFESGDTSSWSATVTE